MKLTCALDKIFKSILDHIDIVDFNHDNHVVYRQFWPTGIIRCSMCYARVLPVTPVLHV